MYMNVSPHLLQYFESDDPDLYTRKIQYILENDVSELCLVFEEEEFDSSGGSSKVRRRALNLTWGGGAPFSNGGQNHT